MTPPPTQPTTPQTSPQPVSQRFLVTGLYAALPIVGATSLYAWASTDSFPTEAVVTAWLLLTLNALAAVILYSRAIGPDFIRFMFWGFLGSGFRLLLLFIAGMGAATLMDFPEASIFIGSLLIGYFIYLKFEIWTLHTCSQQPTC